MINLIISILIVLFLLFLAAYYYTVFVLFSVGYFETKRHFILSLIPFYELLRPSKQEFHQ